MFYRIATSLLAALSLSGCTIGTPFRGPGYPADNPSGQHGEQRFIVAVSHAVLHKDPEKRAAFWRNSWALNRQIWDQEGLIGYRLRRRLLGEEAWTITVWRDEQSLRAFVESDGHKKAIREASASLRAMRFARYDARPSELPVSWEQALAILEEQSPHAAAATVQ